MVVVKDVSKTFITKQKKIDALNGVSFQCSNGQIFGLLGPNGAGKTTLLRILATIMKPTSGHLSVNGYDCVRDFMKVRKQIGYLSTETGIYDRFTPREILRFFGQIGGISKDVLEMRINRVLEEMDIIEYADRRVDRFSTGMKQKVSIARSLIHDPDVIIFDEPTNGLDVIAGRIVKNYILKLKEKGKCVILSTHLMNDVDELCDQIGIIYKGKLVDRGTKDEIKARYNTESIENAFFRIVGEISEV